MKLEAEDTCNSFRFRLVDGKEKSPWAAYSQICYLNGMVGATDYYTGDGEKILTPDEFCQLLATK